MKIVVMANGETLDSPVDQRFGRAPKFIVYDSVTKELRAVDNSQSREAAQGAGIQAAETVSRLGAECLLCGPKAFRALSAAGIRVYSGATGTVAQAIASFEAGSLALAAGANVDAADLHLVLTPEIERREEFRSGRKAVIRAEVLGSDAPAWREPSVRIESATRTTHRTTARETRLRSRGRNGHRPRSPHRRSDRSRMPPHRLPVRPLSRHRKDLLLVDGPPGIGCPVIASITGASAVLVVTEPTLSGEHDLDRVLALSRQLVVPAAVCVNKWDLNPEIATRIEDRAAAQGAAIMGRVRYDHSVTAAQIQAKAVVELGGPLAVDMKKLWDAVDGFLGGKNGSGG